MPRSRPVSREISTLFNIGFGEIIVILIVGFVVVGPRGLPGLARSAARLWREIRRYAEQLSMEVRANMGDLEKELGEIPGELRRTTSAIDQVSDKLARKAGVRDFLDEQIERSGTANSGGEPSPAIPPPVSQEFAADPDLETFVTGNQPAPPKKPEPN